MKKALTGCLVIFASLNLWAHGGPERIIIEPEIQGKLNSGKIVYKFDLFDDQAHKAVKDQDLVDSHTKKLHLIAYDTSLHEFNHVHPVFNGSNWEAELDLPVNGNYFIWAQGELADGTEFSSSVKAQIQGGLEEIPTAPLGDVRKALADGTVVEVASGKVQAGKMIMLDFTVSRQDGTPADITPYLGAFAHVIAVSPDGTRLIHVHPMKGRAPNTGMLHATFPTAGDYRVWIQLNDKGELKTLPLSISVAK
ncbi:hypothetical protein [Bdellovibrio bacteriovorus]|uniref:Secreted protein n=1 Tax=Bdellovibrio bacteriovorus TaxID=959 RepID=A0A1Z3N729_BDEBC|nr:hypothetical protein [Bdellovibrio bacteriovorus]ASD63268.1 hypothetical protein B9G79_06645 [Bdellovibrio bacteriovorus]